MSVVDPGNPNLFSASDFVTQIVDEVNALKQRLIDRVATLQAEDADIRVDYVAADAALNAAIGTALGLRLISPVANLSLPALVPNAALVTGPGGTTLTWDAAYGEFVTNAAALTQAVEDATKAAEDATEAAAAAQAAVDTGAVSKSATADQVMNGNLIVRKDDGALIAQRDDDPAKLVQLRAAPGNSARLEYGSGYSGLYIPGQVAFDTTSSTTAYVGGSLIVSSGAVLSVLAGASLTVAAGGTLTLASLPVNPTDAANKQYVDGPRASALVLPGNAVNPLEAVPLQQIHRVTALRLASDVVGGTGECLFDVSTRDDLGYWNSTTKAVSVPTLWGTVTVNLLVRATSGEPVERSFNLISEGQVKCEVRRLIGTAIATVHLSYTGKLGGTIQVIVNSTVITFLGSTSTNFGLVVFP